MISKLVQGDFREKTVSMINIIPSEPKHIRMMAEFLRDADKREIEAIGLSAYQGVRRSVRGSLIAKAIFVDGELAALFGVGGNILGDIGEPWLVTSPACEKVSPLLFVKVYQKEVLKMLRLFPCLANYVDASYSKAIKLLENSGFKVDEPEELGNNKAFYRKFSMRTA